MKNAAVLVVLAFFRRIDTYSSLELDWSAAWRRSNDSHHFCGAAVETDNLEALFARESQGLRIFTVLELQRQYTHTDQVRAVNAFETFGDHGFHSKQHRAFRGPIARRAR